MAYIPENLEAYVRPSDYGGAHFEDWWTVYGQTRDSDALARSNMRSIARQLGYPTLGDVPNFDPREYDPDRDGPIPPVILTRAGQWAVGWVETLRVHKQAPDDVLRMVDEIIGALQDYPVVDDEDFSELEFTEACDYWAQMSVRERVGYLQDARLCIFAARRAELPDDDNGRLMERLTRV